MKRRASGKHLFDSYHFGLRRKELEIACAKAKEQRQTPFCSVVSGCLQIRDRKNLIRSTC